MDPICAKARISVNNWTQKKIHGTRISQIGAPIEGFSVFEVAASTGTVTDWGGRD
jgi:hypothetical protein